MEYIADIWLYVIQSLIPITVEYIASISLYVVLFLVLINVLVFVHEMGHYLVARWAGVRVEVFSIGFGPELIGWTDRHQTRWKISLLPFGGYVKMFGEMLVPETAQDTEASRMSPEDQADSFHTKGVGRRSAVVAAGPAANFLFAFVVLALLFAIAGQPFTSPKVDNVLPGSAAEQAGLQSGDLFKSIDGTAIERFEDVQRIVGLRPNVPLEIVVLRDDRQVTLNATPTLRVLEDSFGNVHRIGQLGVSRSGRERVRHDPVTAVWQAGKETVNLTVTTLTAVGQMIAGTRPANEVGGPLRIAIFTGDVAQRDVPHLFWFMAYISIALGLINLFPIPMLDGGHLLFYMAEMIRGKPLGARTQEYGFRLGLILVMTLMVFATWNDIVYFMARFY